MTATILYLYAYALHISIPRYKCIAQVPLRSIECPSSIDGYVPSFTLLMTYHRFSTLFSFIRDVATSLAGTISLFSRSGIETKARSETNDNQLKSRKRIGWLLENLRFGSLLLQACEVCYLWLQRLGCVEYVRARAGGSNWWDKVRGCIRICTIQG